MGVETLTRRVVARLEEAGIPALPLKGPLLAAAVHGDSGLRMTNDVDVLVPVDRLHDAVGVVRLEGYGASVPSPGPEGLPELHFELLHDRLPPVEVHWRIHWYESSFSRDMLERSAAANGEPRRADPADELVALLLFYARDGFYGLRHAADLAAWCDGHGPRGGSAWADHHVRAYPRLARPLRAAVAAAVRTVGVPGSQLLSAAGPPSSREVRAVRLASWSGKGDTEQLAANMSLVRALLGSRGSHRSLIRHDFFPVAGDLFKGVSGGPSTLRVRLVHAAKRLTRYGFGLWAVRGGREWEPLPPLP
jgi:hypothetical protein